ncbi:MAG: PKD domain-containing protein [Methanoregula sp.]
MSKIIPKKGTGVCPASWSWSFGDGGTSIQQNPSHSYTTPGFYTVQLTATNAYGSNTETKTGYVVVTAPPTPTPTVTVTPTPTQYSFSITQVGNPGSAGFEDISSAVDLEATILSNSLEHDNKVTWIPVSWKKETSVTKEDLGINGGGLNNAIFHYHAGHGAKDLFILGKTYLALSNGQTLHATDVAGKWGGNNKWVYLDSCDILSDRSWSKALSTTHGIFGYTTKKYTGTKEKTDFIEMAQGRTYPAAAAKPLSKAFYNATRQNQPPSVTAAVIFGNKDQYNNDYLPGHGSMAADKDPNDHSYFYNEWQCVGPEVTS